MKKNHAEQLCQRTGIGRLLSDPQAVNGCHLHRIWHIHTTEGHFAVKQLNPLLLTTAFLQEQYCDNEQIASTFFRREIPAIHAIFINQKVLHHIDQDMYVLYPWIDGHTIEKEEITAEHTRQLGTLLGKLHATNIQPEQSQNDTVKSLFTLHDEDWDILTFQAADQNLAWSHAVRLALPRLIDWSHWYAEVEPQLNQTLLVSHRYLERGNLLWHNNKLVAVLDWESAGPIHPSVEALWTAWHWCSNTRYEPDRDLFASFMQSYTHEAGKTYLPASLIVYGVIGMQLNWLVFFMRRSLGEAIQNDQERQECVQATLKIVEQLNAFVAHLGTWSEMLDVTDPV